MNSCSYWTASHITAFFMIADTSEDLLHKGSLGAGFNIKRGVITDVQLSQTKSHEVFFENHQENEQSAGITFYVVNQLEQLLQRSLPSLSIHHRFDIPIGAGYGSSAAAALSTVFAINELLNLQIPELKLFQIAHKAEISNKTGLGDVLGLYANSAFEQRVKEGAPGIGNIQKLDFDTREYDLYTYSVGPLSKKYLLTDPTKRKMITEQGDIAIKSFELDPTFENFCFVSLEFAKNINLIPKNLWDLIYSLPSTIKGSQIMLGESLFFFVPKSENISKFITLKMTKEELVNETVKKPY